MIHFGTVWSRRRSDCGIRTTDHPLARAILSMSVDRAHRFRTLAVDQGFWIKVMGWGTAPSPLSYKPRDCSFYSVCPLSCAHPKRNPKRSSTGLNLACAGFVAPRNALCSRQIQLPRGVYHRDAEEVVQQHMCSDRKCYTVYHSQREHPI